MKNRNGWISNSSSTSFVVAIKKGFSLDGLVLEGCAFENFAKDVVEYLKENLPPFQSIQNLAYAEAYRDLGVEYAQESVNAGEYDWIVNTCKDLVEDPENWFFAHAWASYNDSYEPIELLLGYDGLEIDCDWLKVKGIGA